MSNIHKNFNSRTREGATKKQLGGRIGLLVSIHAPVWVRRPDEYGLSIKHATKVLRQPDAEPDAARPDQREFFCQATFLNRLQHAPDSRQFSVSLRLAQAQHPMWHHLRKPQLLHVRASLHSIWLIDANRSFLLRPETSSSFLHKTRNSPTGKQEYPDLYTCLAATLMAVN